MTAARAPRRPRACGRPRRRLTPRSKRTERRERKPIRVCCAARVGELDHAAPRSWRVVQAPPSSASRRRCARPRSRSPTCSPRRSREREPRRAIGGFRDEREARRARRVMMMRGSARGFFLHSRPSRGGVSRSRGVDVRTRQPSVFHDTKDARLAVPARHRLAPRLRASLYTSRADLEDRGDALFVFVVEASFPFSEKKPRLRRGRVPSFNTIDWAPRVAAEGSCALRETAPQVGRPVSALHPTPNSPNCTRADSSATTLLETSSTVHVAARGAFRGSPLINGLRRARRASARASH